jgi:hypothetical protein
MRSSVATEVPPNFMTSMGIVEGRRICRARIAV